MGKLISVDQEVFKIVKKNQKQKESMNNSLRRLLKIGTRDSMKNMWWGYVHANGSLQVKRYFGVMDLEEAKESPFVKYIVEPFSAEGRDDAYGILQIKANEKNNTGSTGGKYGTSKS